MTLVVDEHIHDLGQVERAWLGRGHQCVVHLKRRERRTANVSFHFLAHRRPDIGIDGIGTGDRVGRIGEESQPRAMSRDGGGLLHDRRGGISRAVVDDDDFAVQALLADEGLDLGERVWQPGLLVVGRDHERERGAHVELGLGESSAYMAASETT